MLLQFSEAQSWNLIFCWLAGAEVNKIWVESSPDSDSFLYGIFTWYSTADIKDSCAGSESH